MEVDEEMPVPFVFTEVDEHLAGSVSQCNDLTIQVHIRSPGLSDYVSNTYLYHPGTISLSYEQDFPPGVNSQGTTFSATLENVQNGKSCLIQNHRFRQVAAIFRIQCESEETIPICFTLHKRNGTTSRLEQENITIGADEESNRVFGQMIATDIRSLSKRNRLRAKQKIQNILFDLGMEELDNSVEPNCEQLIPGVAAKRLKRENDSEKVIVPDKDSEKVIVPDKDPEKVSKSKTKLTEDESRPTEKTLPSEKKDALFLVDRMFRDGVPNLNKGGKWILLLDNYLELDNAWIAIRKLRTDGKLLAIEWLTFPADNTKKLEKLSCGVICCHTRDFYNVEEVKSAAIDIIDAVSNYRRTIEYKQAKDWFGEGPTLYKFDAENKKFSKLHSFDPEKKTERFPSRVTNVPKLSFGNPYWKKCGKWVLQMDDLTKLDTAWLAIVILFHESKFQAVECSTAAFTDFSGGLIYCYTSDKLILRERKSSAYNEKIFENIELTARCIREAVPDYITDIEYRWADDRHGKALFKFNAKNELLVWDEFDPKGYFYEKAPIVSEEIPSRATSLQWLRLGSDDGHLKWKIIVSKKYRDRNGLTELDKVWSDLKEKFPTNEVCRIICSTAHHGNWKYKDDGCIGFLIRDVNDVEKAALAIRDAVPDYTVDPW